MSIFIGVDGGGTRARAVLVDASGTVTRRAEGPAGIIDARDPGRSVAVIVSLVRGLMKDYAQPPAVLYCGLAGAGGWVEREFARAALQAELPETHVIVVTDADVALADAFDTGPGILLIAGTGSIALARDGAGAMIRVGGWGQLLGDDGSGYALGLAALRAIKRSIDGRGPVTALAAAAAEAAGLTEPADLVHFAATAAKAEIAALAPLVLSCDDDVARRIRSEAVSALAELGVTAASRSALSSPCFALAGGLIEPGGPLREEVALALRRSIEGCSVLETAVDGARGAALLARHAAS
ncbi:BadF/BadG/BcrA/BcrD ATPase family protein [soil metagenome]